MVVQGVGITVTQHTGMCNYGHLIALLCDFLHNINVIELDSRFCLKFSFIKLDINFYNKLL